MARVNVEGWAFGDGRLRRLAKNSQIGEDQALGRLVFLWHDSQELLRVSGTKQEILDWCRADDSPDAERFFIALVAVGYVSLVTSGKLSGEYEIRGNKVQISSRVSNTARGTKGGRATHEKWKQIKNELKNSSLGEGLKPSGGRASALASNAVQTNANQPNPEQGNLLLSDAPKAPRRNRGVPDPVKIETRSTWEAYSAAYSNRYGHEPKRNAKVNSNVKAFVQRLGAEDAPQVAAFYLKHNKGYYVEKRHDVGPMLMDAEALYSQWKAGTQVTRTQANMTDRTQTNANVFGELAERIENGDFDEKQEQAEPERGEATWLNG